MPRRPRAGRTALHMVEPRRNRAKRPTKSEAAKRRRGLTSPEDSDDEFAWEAAESRPLIRDISTERGEDYWVDPVEMEKANEREEAIKNRKAMEGEISKEKLKSEIVAPYKENWIGIFSVFIFAITVIVISFPELVELPVI